MAPLMRRLVLLIALSSGLGAGCNSILGIHDLGTAGSDGGVDASPDAAMSACGPLAPPNTVVGCAVVTHVRADGTTFTTTKDMSGYTVAAYVPNQTGTSFDIISGAGYADGTVRVENVPDGMPFFLRLQDPNEPIYAWPAFYYADKHDLDLGYTELGRDDTPTTADTEATLDLTGMSPWKAGDLIQVDSFNSGVETDFDTGALADGATNAVLTTDWRNGQEEATFRDLVDSQSRVAQLFDHGGQGDDLWVVRFTTKVATDMSFRPSTALTIPEYVKPSTPTMTDGSPVTFAGAFQTAPAVATPLSVTVNLGAARSALGDGNHYGLTSFECTLTANPGADRGLQQQALVVLSRDLYPTDGQITVGGSYTDPFPSAWPKNLTCVLTHVRGELSPTGQNDVSGSYVASTTALTTSNVTWTPVIQTVSNLTIGGRDGLAGGNVPFDGTSPVLISWDKVPGASHYEIRIKDTSTKAFAGKVDTWDSSVTMPAEIFTKGDAYVFRVFAVQTPTDYHGGQLRALDEPLWSSRLTSGQFRFSDLCGNGNVDSGEACDPGPGGASSATCDADCTPAVCGDGFVNTAAGEQCDDRKDSAHCNSDCTTSVCGDGKWNPAAGEECDDGNTTDGDGCTADCHLESCGDGTVQAGEGCDDNNRIDGDGCSAVCQPE